MTDEERAILIEEEKALRFYREALSLAYRHKLKEMKVAARAREAHTVAQGMKAKLQMIRGGRRYIPLRSFREAEKLAIRNQIGSILGTNKIRARNHTYVEFGGMASARKDKTSSHTNFHIRVGYMWFRKVYPLHAIGDFGSWLILSAERVRVNHKLITVYEAKAFNQDTGDTVTGYVAVNRTRKPKSFFSVKAATAIRGAEAAIHHELDEALKGTDNEQDA